MLELYSKQLGSYSLRFFYRVIFCCCFPGILCVADQCHGLKELALNYYILSDELLLALSSEKHVDLEHLRIDVVSENPGQVEFHTIKKQSWDALVKHSPKVNIVMYFFLYEEEFDAFFREETPVTHLYFGRAVSKAMLGRIGMNCPRLIELVVCANGLQPLDDELIRIAERCKNLTAMGLGECEVTCRGFIEFVKMCGGRLTQLSIMEEVLIPDNDYSLDRLHLEVSQHLGRMWFPDMMPTWWILYVCGQNGTIQVLLSMQIKNLKMKCANLVPDWSFSTLRCFRSVTAEHSRMLMVNWNRR